MSETLLERFHDSWALTMIGAGIALFVAWLVIKPIALLYFPVGLLVLAIVGFVLRPGAQQSGESRVGQTINSWVLRAGGGPEGMTRSDDRVVRKVIGGVEMPSGGRAREVVVTYGDSQPLREIEVGIKGRYVPQFREIACEDE